MAFGRARVTVSRARAGVVAAGAWIGSVLASHRRRRLLYSSWLRLTRWEYWPPWAAYIPLVVWIGMLALRHRSLLVFTAANPAIEAGGVIGESKFAILNGLARSRDRVARSALIPASLSPEARRGIAHAFIEREQLQCPVVLKPDAGQRGSGVVVARSLADLHAYLDRSTVDTIVQAYVPGREFGVFYCRKPSEARGRILSVTEKRLPFVVGDGRRSLERLILDDRRAVGMARFHLRRQRHRWHEVPRAGEVISLGDLGTHCRGALFLDGRSVLTPELERAFDEMSKGFEGFYFGRYDVRVRSIEGFMRGRDFTVLELNGVTSEAAHIYDPGVGLLDAYRALFEQWRIAFAIGAENVERGAATASVSDLARLLLRYRRTSEGHLDEQQGERADDAVWQQ